MKKEYEIKGERTENEIRKKIKEEYENLAKRFTCPQCVRKLTMTMSDPVILYDQYARFDRVEYEIRYVCLACTPHLFTKAVAVFYRLCRKNTKGV